MPDSPSCSDCAIPMELGFIPDATYGAILQNRWHPGEPKNATFFGLDLPSVTVNQQDFVPITAYRCSSCGQLKLFANHDSQ